MGRTFIPGLGFTLTVPRRTVNGDKMTGTVTGFFVPIVEKFDPFEKRVHVSIFQYESKEAWLAGQIHEQRYYYEIDESLGFDSRFEESDMSPSNKTLMKQVVSFFGTFVDGTNQNDHNGIDWTQATAVTE